MIAVIIAIIAFSFFIQSLLGFGGGLIAIPLLSLFLPIKEAVMISMIFQFLMGLIIFKTFKLTEWKIIAEIALSAIIGLIFGLIMLHYIPAELMAYILVAIILVHLIKTRLKINIFKEMFSHWGKHASGLAGGLQQAMLGAGGPALVVYLKESSSGRRSVFRANVVAVLFLLNFPRLVSGLWTGMADAVVIESALYALPFFLCSLALGQYLHDKVPEKPFNIGVDIVLLLAAVMLLVKHS